MIHAERVRELTEEILYSSREDTLKFIEKEIEENAKKGYNYCRVQIHKKLVDDIEFVLQNYGYEVHTPFFFPTGTEDVCLKISW